MATISNPPVRRFGDARSLKSLPSAAPSDVKSLKSTKSLNLLMPSILGLKRVQKGSPDVRREEINVGLPLVVDETKETRL
jgi:hypothetical protein